jgi:hypothetical protein
VILQLSSASAVLGQKLAHFHEITFKLLFRIPSFTP